MNQSVKFVRLNTGEDIIAVIDDTSTFDNGGDGTAYIVKNPLKIFYSLMETTPGRTSMGVSLTHWVFPKICKKEEFIIQSRDVLLVSDASPDMVEYYTNSILNIKDSHHIPEEFYDEEEDEDEIEMTDEDAEAIQEMINSIRRDGPKRTLH